eukprot:356917-Chlamydomonas_euryale.AAC.11
MERLHLPYTAKPRSATRACPPSHAAPLHRMAAFTAMPHPRPPLWSHTAHLYRRISTAAPPPPLSMAPHGTL